MHLRHYVSLGNRQHFPGLKSTWATDGKKSSNPRPCQRITWKTLMQFHRRSSDHTCIKLAGMRRVHKSSSQCMSAPMTMHWKMDIASGFKQEANKEVFQNRHSIIWPAGAADVGCKETKDGHLSIRKLVQNVYSYKMVKYVSWSKSK